MKILMIAPTPFFSDRGCHVRIYEEAQHLVSLGHSVTICTYCLGKDINGIDIRRIFSIPWYKKVSAGPSLHKIYLDFLLLLKSLIVTYQTRPDIIHAHLNEGALIGKICGWLFRIPLVFDVQGKLAEEVEAHEFMNGDPFRHKLIHKLMSITEKLSYKAANTFLVNSNFMAEYIHQSVGIRKESIFVVPDAADGLHRSASADEIESLKKRLNIPIDKKIVVYLGLLTEYQGVGLLLRVVKSITEKRDDIHFLIMGYPNVEKYKKISDELNISQYITFTGRISYWEIYKYLALGTIAVAPKFLESGEGNIKVYNYIAAGLPTVVFDYPVNREILGDLGMYARPKDVNSLEGYLTKLLDDKQVRDRLVEKLKAIDIDQYRWENSVHKLLQAYLLLGKRKDNISNIPM